MKQSIKPISLSNAQITIIKAIKGHYQPETGIGRHERIMKINSRKWFESLLPLFEELYGYTINVEMTENEFKELMFTALFTVYRKIRLDGSGEDVQYFDLIKVAMKSTISRPNQCPYERVIAELCGLIQMNEVFIEGSRSKDCNHPPIERYRIL